jgi:hypothetical protein
MPFHNLVDRQTKADLATKKNPKQSTYLGFLEVCCLALGFWVGRQGCRGTLGLPPGPASMNRILYRAGPIQCPAAL